MFKNIKLKKDAWHVKLHTFVFGPCPPGIYFTNFCPYFWLTIFCILAAPFVGSFRGGKLVVEKTLEVCCAVVEKATELADIYICQPLFTRYAKNLSPSIVLSAHKWSEEDYFYHMRHDKRRKKLLAFKKWKELNPN